MKLLKSVALAAIMLVAFPSTVQAAYLDPHQGEIWYKCLASGRVQVGRFSMESWDRSCLATADQSSYAIPVLYKDGVAVAPNKIHLYLRNLTGVTPSILPDGLRMKIGDRKATARQKHWETRYYWQCDATTAGHHRASPPNCPGAENGTPETALTLIIRAPQCFDGTRWEYPDKAACPVGSTTTVQVQYHIQYAIADAADSKMRWSSGSIYGIWAKLRTGWDSVWEQYYIDACIEPGSSCSIKGTEIRLT
jgi:hypothetical protein